MAVLDWLVRRGSHIHAQPIWRALHQGNHLDSDVWDRARGAGEILLTSMDRDVTKDGYDIELLKAITDVVNIPVIASGGVGTPEHIYEALTSGGASAALAASIFHYREYSVREVKEYLAERGIPVRL